MLKTQRRSNLRDGFTLIEVLIAISLVSFSLIAILSSFIFQGKQNNSINDRNVAIVLAEEKIEEYFKFAYDDMPSPDTQIDYIYYNLNRDPIYTTNKSDAGGRISLFERTVTTTQGLNTTLIDVVVRYNYQVSNDRFDFSVNLSTRKGG